MDLLQGAFQYYLQNQAFFWQAFRQHLALSLSALGISIVVSLPLGVWIACRAGLAQVVMNVFNAFRVIPSLAILFLALPYLGLGFLPSLVAPTVLAFPPVVINTYAGLRGVDPAVVEAAFGMGMAPLQVLRQVEIPLAMPVILAGIRLATLSTIGIATIAAYINAGGLGSLLFIGVITANYQKILAGSIAVSFLAITANYLLHFLERRAEIAIRGESK